LKNGSKERAYVLSVMGVLLCCMLWYNPGYAQRNVTKSARILFLLDASSSMGNSWADSTSRFGTASRIVNKIVDSIHKVNPDVAFAVRVFGSQFPAQDKNCFDSRLEVTFNLGNDEQIKARLKYLTPRGYSPIAWSLQQAAEQDFREDDRYAYSIILITDGGESCGGNICATFTNLLEKKISFRPYILSLIDYEPLKQEYACLGKYMTVASEKEIASAVGTIINDNRKVLSIKTSDYRPVAVATSKPTITPVKQAPAPLVVKETPVDNTPKTDNTPKATISAPRKETPAPAPVAADVPAPREKVRAIDLIYHRRTLQTLNLLYTIADANPVKVPKLPPIKIDLPADLQPQPVAATVSAEPKKETTPPVVTAPPKPAVNRNAIVEPVATAARPKSKEVRKTADKNAPADLPFESVSQDAKESSVQIYFTNGRGKFYKTEPKLVFVDSKTKAEVKSVYRNLEGGEPMPIKMEPGTYNLTVPGSKSKANGIVIEPGKNKKVYITVGTGSLEFYYPTAPDRPVKEYTALVSKRFESGPVVKQACDTILPYEPANYHIEINTLPRMMLNVDLDFYSVKVMSIPESGTVQISNTASKGKVQFWYQHGDAYEPFYEMMVNGAPATQKVEFLPGLYQVRYYNGPKGPMAKAEVIMFRVKSNMTTNIELP